GRNASPVKNAVQQRPHVLKQGVDKISLGHFVQSHFLELFNYRNLRLTVRAESSTGLTAKLRTCRRFQFSPTFPTPSLRTTGNLCSTRLKSPETRSVTSPSQAKASYPPWICSPK